MSANGIDIDIDKVQQAAEDVLHCVVEDVSAADIETLEDIKKIYKKAIPFSKRMYVASYLLAQYMKGEHGRGGYGKGADKAKAGARYQSASHTAQSASYTKQQAAQEQHSSSRAQDRARGQTYTTKTSGGITVKMDPPITARGGNKAPSSRAPLNAGSQASSAVVHSAASGRSPTAGQKGGSEGMAADTAEYTAGGGAAKDGRDGAAKDGAVAASTEQASRRPKVEIPEDKAATIFVSIGRGRRVYPRDLVGLFVNAAGIDREHIGDIKVLASYSFVQVYKDDAAVVIQKLNGYDYRGKQLSVSYSKGKGAGGQIAGEEQGAPIAEGASSNEESPAVADSTCVVAGSLAGEAGGIPAGAVTTEALPVEAGNEG